MSPARKSLRTIRSVGGTRLRLALVAFSVAFGAFVGQVHAAQPVLTRSEPLGVVRGETTQVVLHGSRLNDAREVLFDKPGLRVTEVKPIDAAKVEVTLEADADLVPGLYPIQVVTESGISNLRLIGVGAMPVVQEVEPNSDFDTAQKIELNTTIEGVIKFEDVDYFDVELAEGQTIHIEVEGLRLSFDYSNRIFDPYVAVLDSKQFELSESDDTALIQQDPLCSFTAPAAGTYKVMIRDSSFGGSDLAHYRMHVGTFPRPIAVVPAGGVPGDLITATLVHPTGDPESPLVTTSQLQLPSERSDAFPLVIQDDNGIAPSPNLIRVNDLPVTVDTEPNDDIKQGNVAVAPGAFCGVISSPGDVDCYSFECEQGKKYLVQVYARQILRSPLDSVINVYDPKFRSVAANDDQGRNPDSFLEFTAAEAGVYTVRITDRLSRGGPAFAYRLEVDTPRPKLTLDRRELYRDEPHGLSVPKGGAMAMMVTAKRENFGGELILDLPDLPAGVEALTYPMPAGRAEIPVLLVASEDAVGASSLVPMQARTVDESLDLTGPLQLRHRLVLGQNRVDMWGYDSSNLLVSVVEAAPFKIQLDQPRVPIVRNGSMELNVSIERNEGFEGAVSLATLYAPPGLAVNNGRQIPKDQTSITIPMTANGNAAIGNWPMILVATYDSGNGQSRIATNPIDLDIQDAVFKFEFPKVAGELDTPVALQLAVEVMREFVGEGEVELVGFPPGVSSPEPKQSVTPESETVTFPLVIAKDAKVGTHKTLNVVARVTSPDGVITQTQGTGEIRVDQPLPPKTDAPEAPKVEEAKAPPKPLSRLEQLRQMKAGS
ncbi:MAG: serine protease [Planctomycetaceae bacterium]|nr:MAG: serine protease [Planctomycetaceae bacterium]